MTLDDVKKLDPDRALLRAFITKLAAASSAHLCKDELDTLCLEMADTGIEIDPTPRSKELANLYGRLGITPSLHDEP